MKRRERSAREKLLDAAGRLFYTRGINAVGIDEIIAKAGVAKMSLYNNFASKDDLVCEYLRLQGAALDRVFAGAIGKGATARERLLGAFDALERVIGGERFHGCPFIKANAELSGLRPRHPGVRVCEEYKAGFRARLRELAAEAGARDAGALAEQLALLADGALCGPVWGAAAARGAAETLVREALPAPA